jgi:hypothetical protein
MGDVPWRALALQLPEYLGSGAVHVNAPRGPTIAADSVLLSALGTGAILKPLPGILGAQWLGGGVGWRRH